MANIEGKKLYIGDEFLTLKAVEEAMVKFEHDQQVSYWKRNTLTLKAAQRRVDNLQLNPKILYYDLKFTCVKGGRKFSGKGKGKRPNQSTLREDCGAFVSFRATKDAQKLVVVGMNCDHCHLVNKETFQVLPKQRRLNTEEKAEIKKILLTKPNDKNLRNQIKNATGKMLTSRDIRNVTYSFFKPKTEAQKYKSAFNEGQKLATLASEVSTTTYQRRLKVLHDLIKMWEAGEETVVDISYVETIPDVPEMATNLADLPGSSTALKGDLLGMVTNLPGSSLPANVPGTSTALMVNIPGTSTALMLNIPGLTSALQAVVPGSSTTLPVDITGSSKTLPDIPGSKILPAGIPGLATPIPADSELATLTDGSSLLRALTDDIPGLLTALTANALGLSTPRDTSGPTAVTETHNQKTEDSSAQLKTISASRSIKTESQTLDFIHESPEVTQMVVCPKIGDILIKEEPSDTTDMKEEQSDFITDMKEEQSDFITADELNKNEENSENPEISENPENPDNHNHMCDICYSLCSSKSTLQRHKLTHSEKTHICHICSYACHTSGRLDEHLRTHTGEKPFKCDICPYSCTIRTNLFRHRRIHTGRIQKPPKEKSYLCNYCSYSTYEKRRLDEHVRTHTGEKPYLCDLCSYSCSHKCYLNRHKQRNHNK